jgi:hypothetical protein
MKLGKLGLLTASLVLVAGGAVACGGDSDSGGGAKDSGGGDAASVEDFCAAFQGFYDDLTSITGTEDNLGEILKNAAKKIEDAGTPEDIPDDAKEGLELVLDQIDELPDDATADDISGLEGDLTEEEQKKSDAFTEYLNKTCPDIGGESSDGSTDSGSGSAEPSDDPSAS